MVRPAPKNPLNRAKWAIDNHLIVNRKLQRRALKKAKKKSVETFSKEPVATIGIDLAKNSVHVFGVDAQGEVVFSRKLARKALSPFIAQQPTCRIAMEAFSGAHHWARTFQGFGHEVVLIAPQHVKPFVKTNKNDAVDAEAICEAARRPGIGPLVATALIATLGDNWGLFNNGRALAAWLGLVPRQHSTGGKPRLLGISRRGDVYMRKLIINGARAPDLNNGRWVEKKDDALGHWARDLKQRRHANVAVVAMANKLVRIAWAVMTTGTAFDAERGALAKPAAVPA